MPACQRNLNPSRSFRRTCGSRSMLRTYPALHAKLCNYPELISDMSIAYWNTPWLPSFSSFRFQNRVSGQRYTNSKHELDRRVQKIFLKRVNDLILHTF